MLEVATGAGRCPRRRPSIAGRRGPSPAARPSRAAVDEGQVPRSSKRTWSWKLEVPRSASLQFPASSFQFRVSSMHVPLTVAGSGMGLVARTCRPPPSASALTSASRPRASSASAALPSASILGAEELERVPLLPGRDLLRRAVAGVADALGVGACAVGAALDQGGAAAGAGARHGLAGRLVDRQHVAAVHGDARQPVAYVRPWRDAGVAGRPCVSGTSVAYRLFSQTKIAGSFQAVGQVEVPRGTRRRRSTRSSPKNATLTRSVSSSMAE